MYTPFAFFGSSQVPVIFNYYQLYNCGSGGCNSGSNAILGVFDTLGSIQNRVVWDSINKTCGTALSASYISASLYFTTPSDLTLYTYGSNLCGECISQNWNELLIPSGCVKYTIDTISSQSRTFEYTDCTGSVLTQSIQPLPRYGEYETIICSSTKPNITPFPSNSIAYNCSEICYPNKLTTDGLVLLLVSSSYTASTGIWRDISGNCNDAFVSSSPNPVIWNTTLTGSQYGWSFNPTYSQSLQFPATLNATPSSSFTLQMFISASYPYTNPMDLFCKDYFGDGWDTIFNGYNGTNDPPKIIYRDNVGQDAPIQFPGATNTLYTLTVDTNTGIVTGYGSSGNISDVNDDATNSFTASALPLRFGWNTNTDATFFSGSVNSLLIYNRILAPDEIWYNYLNLSSSNYIEVPCSHSVQPQPQPNFPPFPISGSLIVRNTLISNSGSIWYDVSGNGNNALVSGSTLSLSGSLGYAFNGTNNYLTYPEPLTATPSGSWTLQWYGTMYNDSVARDLYCKDFYNDGWDIIYNGSGGLTYRDQAGSDKGISITNVSATKTLWTLVGNDAANTIITYKNGGLVGTMSAGAVNAFNATGTPFKFGFNTNTDATYFKGTIVELLVYNKGLSASEVSQSYTYLNTYFP